MKESVIKALGLIETDKTYADSYALNLPIFQIEGTEIFSTKYDMNGFSSHNNNYTWFFASDNDVHARFRVVDQMLEDPGFGKDYVIRTMNKMIERLKKKI
ncbi:hypothetical protein [Salinimicrobium sp. GXAS 041]|uniref:hypothetical protein n=1 Tax=Salinimicrobium sp. GXAS 041 TaxID=3400806 RepID=UPI003C76589B